MAKTATKKIAVRSLKEARGNTAEVIRLCLRKAGASGPEIRDFIASVKRPSKYSLSRTAKRFGLKFSVSNDAADGLLRYHFTKPVVTKAKANTTTDAAQPAAKKPPVKRVAAKRAAASKPEAVAA